jgi:hypothetical protein
MEDEAAPGLVKAILIGGHYNGKILLVDPQCHSLVIVLELEIGLEVYLSPSYISASRIPTITYTNTGKADPRNGLLRFDYDK